MRRLVGGIMFILLLGLAYAECNETEITDQNSCFVANVTSGSGFYENGTYVPPITKVNWSEGTGDLEGIGLSPTVKVANFYYAILVDWTNISNTPTNVSYFNNDANYITINDVPVYENLSQFINDMGYLIQSNLTYLDTAISTLTANKSGIGSCPDGYAVQNLTPALPDCLPVISTETDPLFTSENATLWQAINSKLDMTDQRYNETAFILEVNNSLSAVILNLDLINQSIVQEILDRAYYDGLLNDSIQLKLDATDQRYNDTAYILLQLANYYNMSESDARYLQNESDPLFTAENASLWLAINSKLDITDQRYNDTLFVISYVNSLNLTNGTDGINGTNGIDGLNGTISVQGDSIYTYNTTNGTVTTIWFNESKLNSTVYELTGIFEENVTITVSGGVGSGTTVDCCTGASEILQIAVLPTTITNKYRFFANTSLTGEIVDSDHALHTGNWIVAHAGSVVTNENVNYYITNALIDETFVVRIRWQR